MAFVETTISKFKKAQTAIKSSALFQPEYRWLLRTLSILAGVVLTTVSYHFMSQTWADGYSASRTKSGDYSLFWMFPMNSLRATLLGLLFASGMTLFIYAVTLPRVRRSIKKSD